MTPPSAPPSAISALRCVSLLEGSTLLALVGVAVPLKHLAGWPGAVSVLGPLHGLAFLAYLWLLVRAASEGRWPAREVLRLLAAALIPFGAYFNLGFLRRKQQAAPAP